MLRQKYLPSDRFRGHFYCQFRSRGRTPDPFVGGLFFGWKFGGGLSRGVEVDEHDGAEALETSCLRSRNRCPQPRSEGAGA